jgi:hypothetical protein
MRWAESLEAAHGQRIVVASVSDEKGMLRLKGLRQIGPPKISQWIQKQFYG